MLNTHIASQIYAKICFETTLSQKKVVEKLSDYIIDDDFSKIFVLNGYAGTGKTTLISAFVAVLNDLKIKSILLAPTGRAAKVLALHSKENANTIHKCIYREKINADYQSKFSLNINKEQDVVFIVDEVSMLSNKSSEGTIFGTGSLLDDLVMYVRSGKRCRLILVGDNAQLPPVGSENSPALDPSELFQYGEVIYSTMDEVVRQEYQSGILFNATMVRCMVESKIYETPIFNMDYPDIKAIDGAEFIERLEECYCRYGREDTIVITRSNKRANRYNEGIRRNILGAEEEIESGDMLMVVKNNYFFTAKESGEKGDEKSDEKSDEKGGEKGDEKRSPMSFIANGDVVRLKSIKRFEDFYGFRFADATLAFPDYDDIELNCKILLDTINSESPSLTYEESKKLFYEVEKDYLDMKSRLKRIKEIRDNPHFNAIQVKFSYAVTCHKAQGGEWKAVFVDRLLFGDEEMTKDKLKWLYTAITRASERLYLVNFDSTFFE